MGEDIDQFRKSWIRELNTVASLLRGEPNVRYEVRTEDEAGVATGFYYGDFDEVRDQIGEDLAEDLEAGETLVGIFRVTTKVVTEVEELDASLFPPESRKSIYRQSLPADDA